MNGSLNVAFDLALLRSAYDDLVFPGVETTCRLRVMCDVWYVWCVMCDMCDVWCVICVMCDVWCVMCDVWCVMCDVW
jgi:hypothetical protein